MNVLAEKLYITKRDTMSKMSNKEMFISLTGQGVPAGEVKEAMFSFHNKYFGKSPHVIKIENVNTFCGSCIQRVKANCWKVYHSKDYRWSYEELEWTGRLGMHNAPVYRLSQEALNKKVIR